MVRRRKKTTLRSTIDKKKKALKKTSKRVTKKITKASKRTRKKINRRVKKVRRVVLKKSKVAKRKAKRFSKSLKRSANKKIKAYKRKRAKAYRARFRRSNITTDNKDLIGFTSDRSQKSERTAFVRQLSDGKGASRPGEPPKMRTGRGRDSIKAELISDKSNQHNVTSRVYVDKKEAAYMAMWEYRQDGKQRPFLKPALEDNQKMLGDLIGKRLRSKLRSSTATKRKFT